MTYQTAQVRTGLPKDMQVLLRDYPRDAWPDHPNFARSIQNWMGAHDMFRNLSELNQKETELYLTKSRDPQEFAGRLSFYGDLLVRNLHGHHTWEDRDYFPELQAADPRFAHGLDMLEGDHLQMDEVLDGFTRQANRVVQLIQLDEAQAREEANILHDTCGDIRAFLSRHLEDEEDLIVPILLHHKLRG